LHGKFLVYYRRWGATAKSEAEVVSIPRLAGKSGFLRLRTWSKRVLYVRVISRRSSFFAQAITDRSSLLFPCSGSLMRIVWGPVAKVCGRQVLPGRRSVYNTSPVDSLITCTTG